jgi:hypothetical protein
MPVLLLPSRWRRQPTQRPAVDWASPLAVGLEFLLEPIIGKRITPRNLANANNVTNEASAPTPDQFFEIASTQWGTIGGIGNDFIYEEFLLPASYLNSRFSITGEATLVAILRSTGQDASGDSSALILRTSGSAEHYPYTDGNIYLGSFHTSRWVNGVAPPSSISAPHMIAITAKSGAQEFFYNNVSKATGTVASTPSMLGRFGTMGRIYYMALWSRILSRAQLTEIYCNPWQIFRPDLRRVYVTAAATSFAEGSGIASGLASSIGAATLQYLGTATASGVGSTDYLGQMLTTAEAVASGFGFGWATDASTSLYSRYARPIADISSGAWSPSAGADLYAMLDEESASDADYVLTSSASTFEVRMAPLDPSAATNHTLRWRVPAGFTPVGSLTITLRQGASTQIATIYSGAVTADTDYSYTLTSGEVAAISDYTDLRVRVTSS